MRRTKVSVVGAQASGKAALRAIFIEYEPARAEDEAMRPFHHARLVVADVGQHEDGSALTKDSTGRVFDRYGAKQFTELDGNDPSGATSFVDKVTAGAVSHAVSKATLRKEREFDVVEEDELYEGLQPGYWSKYHGFTKLSFDEIKLHVNGKVENAIKNGEKYNFILNNCEQFALGLAQDINAAIIFTTTGNIGGRSAGPLAKLLVADFFSGGRSEATEQVAGMVADKNRGKGYCRDFLAIQTIEQALRDSRE